MVQFVEKENAFATYIRTEYSKYFVCHAEYENT